MLSEINHVLETFAEENQYEKVFYGAATDKSGKMKHWNYIIFRRARTPIDYISQTDYIEVVIVHEDYVPEGTAETLINRLRDLGYKCSGEITYEFAFKPGTDLGVEAAEFVVSKSRKACKNE